MADGRHFENRYSSIYLSHESSEFDEIWYADANIEQGDGNENSQIQDGGRTPYLKSFFGYNSAPYCPIKTKFGVRRLNRTHTKDGWRNVKFRKFSMADGRHFENHLYLSIWAANRPNYTKFSMRIQILSQATEAWQKIRNPQFKMSDGRHIENHFWLYYNSAACCPIKMKFGVRRQNNTHTKQVRWSNA